MPKWSDVFTRLLMPWSSTVDEVDVEQIREECAEVRREQQALAPFIDAQTEYLVSKAELNGFTRQLRYGFQRRDAAK